MPHNHGSARFVGIECAARLDHRDERALQHVFGVGAVAAQPRRDAQQLGRRAIDQLAERTRVAAELVVREQAIRSSEVQRHGAPPSGERGPVRHAAQKNLADHAARTRRVRSATVRPAGFRHRSDDVSPNER